MMAYRYNIATELPAAAHRHRAVTAHSIGRCARAWCSITWKKKKRTFILTVACSARKLAALMAALPAQYAQCIPK
jgi:hypothetical protein